MIFLDSTTLVDSHTSLLIDQSVHGKYWYLQPFLLRPIK
jgi:hypothetical protein